MSHYPHYAAAFDKLLAGLPGRKISVVGHQRPDGDCIGSQVALCRVLRAKGMDALCINSDRVPRRLKFLVSDTPFIPCDEADHTGREAIFTDCADHDRAGDKLRKIFPSPLGCFDHHLSNPGYAKHNFVDTGSAATAELLAGLFFDAGLPMDPTTAQALYTGIMTDTGRFRFPSTTQRVFRLVADLMARGADPAEAGRQLYENESRGRIRLLQYYLGALRFECDGRVCIGVLPEGIFEQLGATVEDTDGLVDYARSVSGVEIGVLIEERPGVIKASLRAKHAAYRMDEVASRFGGGGHGSAAGLNFPGALPGFYPRLLAVLTRRLEECGAAGLQ